MTRDYGPHDPATAPTAVTVLGGSRWPREDQVPVPSALREQRARINAHAWRASCR